MAADYANYRYFSLFLCEKDHSITLQHEKWGILCKQLVFSVSGKDLDQKPFHYAIEDYPRVYTALEKHVDSRGFRITYADGPKELPLLMLHFELEAQRITIRIIADANPSYRFTLSGLCCFGDNPKEDILTLLDGEDGVLHATMGPAASPLSHALFDRQHDRMLHFSFPMGFCYDYERDGYRFAPTWQGGTAEMSLIMTLSENVMKQEYGIPYRRIRPKLNGQVPAGFMTWDALKFDTNEATLLANVKAQAEHLASYGANIIWVDWEWYHNGLNQGSEDCDTLTPSPIRYPHGMKYIADTIRNYGFIPAIWVSPDHEVRKNEHMKRCPEMILTERRTWCGDYILDPTHPYYLNTYLPAVFTMIRDWGYGAVKWDTRPLALEIYDELHKHFADPTQSSEAAMRKGDEIARQILGEDCYMMTCHGEGSRDFLMSADIFDGARIGLDIFDWGKFIQSGVNRIFKFYPFHNTMLYCDPDNIVIREEYNTMDQAISRVSLISLLGLPINIGDDLTVLPQERLSLLKQILPGIQVKPASLSAKTFAQDVITVSVRVATSWERYQLVDIFNTSDKQQAVTLSRETLGIAEEERIVAFDYWKRKYLGEVSSVLNVICQPYESCVLAIRPLSDHPQLISTTRHLAQGYQEIETLMWKEEPCLLQGRIRLVAHDEVQLYFRVPHGYRSLDFPVENEIGQWRMCSETDDAVDFTLRFEKTIK